MVRTAPPPGRPLKVRFDPLDVALGKAVRAVMVASGVDREALTDHLDLSVNSISRRLTGDVSFTYAEIVRIAEATHTTVAAIAASAQAIYSRSSAA